jgi:hypothetical protein
MVVTVVVVVVVVVSRKRCLRRIWALHRMQPIRRKQLLARRWALHRMQPSGFRPFRNLLVVVGGGGGGVCVCACVCARVGFQETLLMKRVRTLLLSRPIPFPFFPALPPCCLCWPIVLCRCFLLTFFYLTSIYSLGRVACE